MRTAWLESLGDWPATPSSEILDCCSVSSATGAAVSSSGLQNLKFELREAGQDLQHQGHQVNGNNEGHFVAVSQRPTSTKPYNAGQQTVGE